ncbi:MAG TPA: HNH endonuclease [Chloroflexota bacterium]
MLNGRRHNGLAHRLVWRHFNGPIPDGLTINHRNGVKNDNRPENLEIVTPSENAKHAVRVLKVGRTAHQNGEANHAAKLTAQQVQEIRMMRASGERLLSIAAAFGVTFQAISKIARGDRWRSG